MSFAKQLAIHTSRLIIKPFTAEDAEESYACITPSLTRFMSWEPPRNREEYDAIWQTWLVHITQDIEYHFVIRNKDNGEFLGLCGLHDVQLATPELGIWIREDRHGLSFGKEAVTAVAKWASNLECYTHFIYPVAIENTASRRIAESLGGVESYCTNAKKYLSITYLIPSRII